MGRTHYRLRVCFRKAGRLRDLSHLEVGRAIERAARRARLPYAVTQGFNPRLRAAFGPALPVGTAGEHEYFDLWLTDYVPADEVLETLIGVSVEELAPSRAGYVNERGPSLSAILTIARYELELEAAMGSHDMQSALEAVGKTGELVTERKGRTKVFDLTTTLPKEPVVSARRDRLVVDMTVRMGPAGSLRPETFVRSALEVSGTPVGRILVDRIDLLVEEESEWCSPL